MELQYAKALLDEAVRSELRDHAFGDAEVHWHQNGVEVASGYFSGTIKEVCVEYGHDNFAFRGAEADELRQCGIIGDIERNDVAGPVQYHEGQMMERLTPEYVRHELES